MSSHKSRSAARLGTKPTARQERRGAKVRNDAKLILNVDFLKRVRMPAKPAVELARPLTKRQQEYDVAIASKTLIFAVGPAGTGKTWLAATRAAERLVNRSVERVIVTRPTIEAGASLGFLPGELEEKNEPYFRPVRDAMQETLGDGMLEALLKDGTIEARPLAYLRGATFKNCVVILDEAQNVTPQEMKLFLTRIGENCTVIVDGDPDQKDIPGISGLGDAINRLHDHPEVEVIRFGVDDIVRSGFCMDVVKAYSRDV